MMDVLKQTDAVSYYSFLMNLSKHDGVNQAVGTFFIIIIIMIMVQTAACFRVPHPCVCVCVWSLGAASSPTYPP